jgi:hypothetical protein
VAAKLDVARIAAMDLVAIRTTWCGGATRRRSCWGVSPAMGADDTDIQNFTSRQNMPGGQTVRSTHATTYTAIAYGTAQNPSLS